MELSQNICFAATNNVQNQAQTTTEQCKQKRQKWSSAEDIVLISAWLNTSKDPIVVVGNDQRPSAFWKRIAVYYASSPAAINLPKREPSHCKQRWQKITGIVSNFVGCYDRALSQRTSGQSEDDVIQVAYQYYFNDYNAKFTLEHAWRKLRHDKKWITSNQKEKGTGSSKRTKLDEGGAYSLSSNTSNVDEQAEARPLGVQAAKNKGKKVVTRTTIEERETSSPSRLENLWELKEKDIAERKKLSKMDLLKILLGKTELSDKEETLKDKLIDEML